ncbi:MAG: penicillin acylase family protein, partial [Kofleriaceae bacterium]|nr:penicillin acylase family protein [Kofleriaceae bacterium]
AIWYMVHIDSKTKGQGNLHISGSSFPGMPGILFGQNEKLAWGVTTAFFDQSDVYLETLSPDGTAVIFNGNEAPILNVDHSYKIAGSDTPIVRRAQYVPHHGPILSIDLKAGTAVSLRWAAQDADTDFNFLWEIWTANTTAEAKEALNNVTSAGQSFVVADVAGDIGWYPYNRVPSRPWMATYKPWLPLPGDGSAEWGPYVPYADLPQVTNPSVGYVATANNDMTGSLFDGDPTNDGQAAIQTIVADGYRHERITELLAAKDDHTVLDMQTIQADTKSLYGERIAPLLVADADSKTGLSAEASALVSSLRAWDFYCPSGYDNTDPESPVKNTEPATIASAKGCAAFHVVWPRLRKRTFGDEIAAAGGTFRPRNQPMALAFLRPEIQSQSYWDDVSTMSVVEERSDIVVAALEDAALYLSAELGSNQDDWRWGALHTVYLPADLFDSAGVPDFSNGPFIHDGAMSTVDVAAPRNDLDDDYVNIHGASIRLTCEADSTGVACQYQLPGGQRHHRDDGFYNSLLDKWLSNSSVDLPFSISEEIAGAVDSILVE